MRIGLYAPDSKMPNLALMKLSMYHKAKGDKVDWFSPWKNFDKLYISKIYTFSESELEITPKIPEIVHGGSGISLKKVLPDWVDCLTPDYSIYPMFKSMSFYNFLKVRNSLKYFEKYMTRIKEWS